MKEMDLCGKCAAKLRGEGCTVQRIAGGVNQKVTCERCGRRRYGARCQAETPRER